MYSRAPWREYTEKTAPKNRKNLKGIFQISFQISNIPKYERFLKNPIRNRVGKSAEIWKVFEKFHRYSLVVSLVPKWNKRVPGSVSSRATIRNEAIQSSDRCGLSLTSPLHPLMGDSPALWELGMGIHGLSAFSAGRSPTCQGVYGASFCLLHLSWVWSSLCLD